MGGHLLTGTAVDDDRVVGAESPGHPRGIHRGVAAAVHGDVPPERRGGTVGDVAQERQRVDHWARVAGRDVDAFGQMRADGDEDRVEAALVPLGGEVFDPMVTRHAHAHGGDLLHFRVEHVAGQPVTRDPVPHHSAGHRACVADLDLMAHARQVVGGGQSAWPRTDDQHAFAARRRHRAEGPAVLPCLIAEEALDRVDRHRTIEMRSVAHRFTRVVAHPAVDGGEGVVLDELTPRGLVPTCGCVREPGLDVLPCGASCVAGWQKVDVDGSAFALRTCPLVPVGQVGEARDVLEAGHQPWNLTVVPGISSTTRPWHSTSIPGASRGSTLMITPLPLTRRCRCRPR